MSGDNEGEPGAHNDPLSAYAPVHFGPTLPHYYGDYVRQIFMLCGAIMLILAPFLDSTMPALLPFEIGGALIIAILGALTNPQNQLSMLANAIAAGVGVVMYELLALSLYGSGSMLAFLEREVLAVFFLFALYFSLKTLRNMVLHHIGKRDTFGDFAEEPQKLSGDGD